MYISEERQEVFHKMIMPTTPVEVKSIFGALEYVSHCLPSFKLLDAPLIDIVKEGTNKDLTLLISTILVVSNYPNYIFQFNSPLLST